MKFSSILLIALISYSCVSGQKDNSVVRDAEQIHETNEDFDYMSALEQEIVGEWTNASMRIWVKTYNNSDTSFIVDITEENWELKMNIKPIVTTIHEDGTYMSEYRNSFDSLIYDNPRGTWLIDGDTLIMEDGKATYKYQIFIDGDRAEFNSLIDWDGDGVADDEYTGVQKRNY